MYIQMWLIQVHSRRHSCNMVIQLFKILDSRQFSLVLSHVFKLNVSGALQKRRTYTYSYKTRQRKTMTAEVRYMVTGKGLFTLSVSAYATSATAQETLALFAQVVFTLRKWSLSDTASVSAVSAFVRLMLCRCGSPAITYSLVACCGKQEKSFKRFMNVVVISLDYSVTFVEGVGGGDNTHVQRSGTHVNLTGCNK